ncbi:MAG TPA: universal stress protein [Ilumatobacteraceae bacterium]|nr:universal stress protein [Ilumatobacteraceae bacterium]
MVQHLIVPVDGSDAAWRAVDVAMALARRCDTNVEIIEMVSDTTEITDAEARLADRFDQHDTNGLEVTTKAIVTTDGVADGIAGEVDRHPEVTVVMASHGRGRSAALLGSVAEELLQRVFGPILVVGPHCELGGFDGPVIVTVDGSSASESVLPLAAAWGIELRAEPWIVEVVEPDVRTSGDVAESTYPARLARTLAADTGHPVQFDVLHGHDVHDEIADFADSLHASLIVASTHGRSGMERIVTGSTAAAIVRHARCPVLLARPPHLTAL